MVYRGSQAQRLESSCGTWFSLALTMNAEPKVAVANSICFAPVHIEPINGGQCHGAPTQLEGRAVCPWMEVLIGHVTSPNHRIELRFLARPTGLRDKKGKAI
jgi:hypothetical protein